MKRQRRNGKILPCGADYRFTFIDAKPANPRIAMIRAYHELSAGVLLLMADLIFARKRCAFDGENAISAINSMLRSPEDPSMS
jgi:hypothetical protein